MRTKATAALESGRDFLSLHAAMQMIDNRALLVESCKKILELDDVSVRLHTGKLEVQIWGRNLHVTDLNAGGVRVHGIIQSVELKPRRVSQKERP